MFADDVCIYSDTAIKVQRQINTIREFCHNTGMELNLNKTEIIVFRNGGYLRNYEKCIYNSTQIQTTSIYKYMALLFTPKLSWTSAKIKLAAQAEKALISIKNYERAYGHLLHSEISKLFDAIIKLIVCYGYKIWDYEFCEIIEYVQINLCRRILSVNKTVNNCMILGECGRFPLCVTYQTNCIKYWCKLLQINYTRYPKQCYNMLKSVDDIGRVTWATRMKNL